MMHYDNWKEAKWDNERWPNFSPSEIAERSHGWNVGKSPVLIIPEFVDKMQHLRDLCGFPLTVTSWYRSPEYNDKVSSTGKTGPHTTGRAVDIEILGDKALILIEHAIDLGFTGIGVSQKGPHRKRFIHLDTLENGETPGPRRWLWSY